MSEVERSTLDSIIFEGISGLFIRGMLEVFLNVVEFLWRALLLVSFDDSFSERTFRVF